MRPDNELAAGLAHTVDVWLLDPERVGATADLDDGAALLSTAERDHAARLLLPEVRRTYVLTRALVRRTLSRYVPVNPSAWTFARSAYGRPEIEGPAGAPALYFSVSHTTGLIGCAVARAREVGLDLEDTAPRSLDPLRVAARFLSRPERDALRGLSAEAATRQFFALWTLKEAYAKARGLGLSLPPERFTVALDGSGHARLVADEVFAEDRAAWQLTPLQPTARHVGALALRRGPAPDLGVSVAWV
jgi:4'-phosphopantetheinyl transferase